MIMRTKSIAFVHNTMAIGGIEKSLINLLNRIDYTEVSVDLYMLTTAGILLNEINPNVNIIFRINLFEKALAMLTARTSGLLLTLFTIAQKIQRRLTRLMSGLPNIGKRVLGAHVAKRYDVVFALNQGSVQIFTLENMNSEKKYAFYHNGNIELFNRYIHLFKKFDGIITVSNEVSKLITAHHLNIAKKLHVVHNIVPKDDICSRSMAETIQFDHQNERCIIVSCGRLYRDKGFDLAVDAARILSEQKLLDFSWYIIGDGKERHRLERRIRDMSLQDHVFLLGWKLNPYPHIRACDIYVQPSRVESFGISIVEAQILAKAVVSTRTLGATEVIDDGKTGLLCDVSASALAEKIAALISDSKLKSKIEEGVLHIDFASRNHSAMEKFYNLICSL